MQATEFEEHLSGELNAWSNDLTVEVGGHGVASHAGSAVLRLLADNTGLTEALSTALRRRGVTPVHDRGRSWSTQRHLGHHPVNLAGEDHS
jgi:hypothetical protein